MISQNYRKFCVAAATAILGVLTLPAGADSLRQQFDSPPASARPWVYWFFMDGNETRRGMRADLEAMRAAGIGGVIRMDVNIGVPKGKVAFMSPEWRANFAYGVQEAKRLGLQFSEETGPGWCGDGGPWIRPDESMQHLVSTQTTVTGPARFDGVLPRPSPRAPYFGEGTMSPELRREWLDFYKDEYVIAFPTPAGNARIDDVDTKAFYYRGSASSGNVAWQFDAPTGQPSVPANECIPLAKIVDLTGKLTSDGHLAWRVPVGKWTIMRFGRTTTGQTTRPAPDAGLGFESDKFDLDGVTTQFNHFIGPLLHDVGRANYGGVGASQASAPSRRVAGLTMIHFDSWEVSSQNWSAHFRKDFIARRGYDPLPYLPVMAGWIVGSRAQSERFLWDLRETASELIVDVHARYLADYAHRHGLTLSIEPYDLNPSADMDLGAMADVPMAEFWSTGYAAPTNYSCVEATSIAHTNGRKVVGAESFTAGPGEDWHKYPGAMKEQLDWALCAGINKFVFHRYEHQPDMDKYPGMMMGPYGVNWERTETWWSMVPAFHEYVARCSQMLRQGLPVADILYLTPEGAPQVFVAPDDALTDSLDANLLPDRKGYNFDGCSPRNLIAHASVRNGRIVFPDGMSYRVLVLPEWDTMTPGLLRKIVQLVDDGATVIGAPPSTSPSLSNYPACDAEVKSLANQLWPASNPLVGWASRPSSHPTDPEIRYGRGTVIFDREKSAGHAGLSDARWIWFDEGDPVRAAPAGARYFRTSVVVSPGRKLESATAIVEADNSFEFYINGHDVGGGHSWSTPSTIDITRWLRPGKNDIRMTAVNDPGSGDNPAGLIGNIAIDYVDGGRQSVVTGEGWTASKAPTGPFMAARVLGPRNIAPWESGQRTVVYQRYATTADTLRSLGVKPDFTSGKPIRYIHRHLADGELYFIANKKATPVETTCTFRVAGRRPEWWDPISGDRHDLVDYSAANGVTTIPVRLGPLESGFVVFRKPTTVRNSRGVNFPAYRTVLTLTRPWNVAFDPRWGGPAHVVFPALEDWSKRTEAGIRYYSGKAVYTTTFDAPASIVGGKCVISLGDVKNLATVRLNGKPVGTVWCAPWRVEIPAGLLKRHNTLAVTVANLWVNRLIGDSGLPESERLTSVTYNNYRPGSPLEPSGLLGPVTIQKRGQ